MIDRSIIPSAFHGVVFSLFWKLGGKKKNKNTPGQEILSWGIIAPHRLHHQLQHKKKGEEEEKTREGGSTLAQRLNQHEHLFTRLSSSLLSRQFSFFFLEIFIFIFFLSRGVKEETMGGYLCWLDCEHTYDFSYFSLKGTGERKKREEEGPRGLQMYTREGTSQRVASQGAKAAIFHE